MDYEKLKKGLKGSEQGKLNYLSYLRELETDIDKEGKVKAWWFSKLREESYIFAYNKVLDTGFELDGTDITLSFKGKLLIDYNYKAYKNVILKTYPETVFDVGIVRADDEIDFHKQSGLVFYTHKFHGVFNDYDMNPVVGAYCIIKNKRGEFIETINRKDIEDFKSVAKTLTIWRKWENEMIKKSVIKRACKFHFSDIVKDVDVLDNENYTNKMTGYEVDEELRTKIDNCTTVEEVQLLYSGIIEDIEPEQKNDFVDLCNERRNELLNIEA